MNEQTQQTENTVTENNTENVNQESTVPSLLDVANKQVSDDVKHTTEHPTENKEDRPDFLLDKYYTKDRSINEALAEQAKAYTELEKKFGGFTGAPEEYGLEALSETGLEIDSSSELAQEFLNFAKETNMSQQTFDQLMTIYAKDFQNNLPLNRQQILDAIGEEGMENYQNIGQWAANILTTDEMAILDGSIHNVEMLNVLDKIRRSTSSTNTVPTNSEHPDKTSGVHDSMDRINSDTQAIYREAGRDTQMFDRLYKERRIAERISRISK